MSYKLVKINDDDVVNGFNTDELFKLRRHCVVHGVSRDTLVATKASIIQVDAMDMGWCQAVYGPLPGKRPDIIAVVKYTGSIDGVLVLPLHWDGKPYTTKCYDDNNDQEYCIWMDRIDMDYDDMMWYLLKNSLRSMCD